MAKNYGIKWAIWVLKNIEKTEDDMINSTGYGFEYMSRPHRTQIEYTELLKKWRRKKAGGTPQVTIHQYTDHFNKTGEYYERINKE